MQPQVPLIDSPPLGHLHDKKNTTPLGSAALVLQAMKHHDCRRNCLHIPFHVTQPSLKFCPSEFGCLGRLLSLELALRWFFT